MKRKVFLAFAGAMIAGASFASVSASNIVCRIAISSVETNTIVSLPLVDIGVPGVSTINATNYVLTVGLKAGDRLLQKTANDDGVFEYQGWTLLTDGGEWTAVTLSSSSITVPALQSAVFQRGGALMLSRTDPESSNPFYLLGQVATDPIEVSPVAGTRTMMANMLPYPVDILDLPYKDGTSPATLDVISVPTAFNGENLYWTVPTSGGKATWCRNQRVNRRNSYVAVEQGTVVVPAGTGFWYMSAGSTVPTFKWQYEE